ncbi:MAG: CRISP-associated protein Cas1 [Bacillota bacterium]|nr:MAG: CRISP-associated protein Cas1 [Bacillota bacterium]
MRRLLNTLYVTGPDSYLARDGENVVVRVAEEVKLRIPVHNLEGIVCFGYAGASPSLMSLCCERGVGLSFLTEHGRFLARVSGTVSGNVLLRRHQHRRTEDLEASNNLAKHFVVAKIHNSRTSLQRAVRDHVHTQEPLSVAIKTLSNVISRVTNSPDLDVLRGLEGEAAAEYFGVFDHLIVAQKEEFSFSRRVRRPPTDKVNAMLSFLYTLLAHDAASALETVGLDPQMGFLHRDRPGRAGLALDLMEELRPYLADRLVLTMINRRQVTADGFLQKENGAVIMDPSTRKAVLEAWQKRKQEEIEHPFLNEKIPIGLLPYTQAMLLARYLRGDLDDYPPFFWR